MIDVFITIDRNFENNWRHVYNSIKDNTKEKISFNILCEDNVNITCSENDINVIRVKPIVEIIKSFNGKGTRAIYLRWLIPDYAKQDRAIYLDADVIVLGDVKELWEMNLEYYVMGCVPSYIFPTIGDPIFQSIQGEYQETGIINYLSGQIVFNCDYWNRLMIKQKLIDFVNLYNVLDELAMDVVCDDLIKPLDKYWCVPASYVTKDWKHPKILHDYDIDKVKLWHYSGPWKPWMRINGRNYEYYKKYA